MSLENLQVLFQNNYTCFLTSACQLLHLSDSPVLRTRLQLEPFTNNNIIIQCKINVFHDPNNMYTHDSDEVIFIRLQGPVHILA